LCCLYTSIADGAIPFKSYTSLRRLIRFYVRHFIHNIEGSQDSIVCDLLKLAIVETPLFTVE